jgi:hypothetical protein
VHMAKVIGCCGQEAARVRDQRHGEGPPPACRWRSSHGHPRVPRAGRNVRGHRGYRRVARLSCSTRGASPALSGRWTPPRPPSLASAPASS